MPFEVSAGSLSGSINPVAVFETGGVAPTTIIRTDQNWTVRVSWTLAGSLLPLLTGSWRVRLRLESMGPGAEFSLPPAAVALTAGTGTATNRLYEHVFAIPAGSVPVIDGCTEFRLLASVGILNPAGIPGPIAGFVEGPIVQLYNPGP